MELRVVSSESDIATTDRVYLNESDLRVLGATRVVVGDGFVYEVGVRASLESGTIAMTSCQRKTLEVSKNRSVRVAPFVDDIDDCTTAFVTLHHLGSKTEPVEVSESQLVESIRTDFLHHPIHAKQWVLLEFNGVLYRLEIGGLAVSGTPRDLAALGPDTEFVFMNSCTKNPVRVTSDGGQASSLFKRSWNLSELGIGGMDAQVAEIFRRAFASRVFAPEVARSMGIQHVKGILLYGPAGTGKTLIARQIGKLLNGRAAKVVSGPSLLNKYVGGSEENVRALFREAEAEQAEKGDASELHVVIMDEMDALCRTRGSGGDGGSAAAAHDGVVNQLLSKIDGVDSLNNLLLIGTTNRKDLIDDALLRPGRFEVHVEVGLPDEAGRLQILHVHTRKLSAGNFMAPDVDLAALARITENFSGAELEGLVKSAASYALSRDLDLGDIGEHPDPGCVKVWHADFTRALDHDVHAAFGASSANLDRFTPHGILDLGPACAGVRETLRELTQHLERSDTHCLESCLLSGMRGCGQSALAAAAAKESGFPFVRVVSAEDLLGMTEQAKSAWLSDVFHDAYRSPASAVILDDVERLIEYVPVGPRFSNAVLQTLVTLVRRTPPPGHKILVIGTTSDRGAMEDLGLVDAFGTTVTVPLVSDEDVRVVLEQTGAFSEPDLSDAAELLVNMAFGVKTLLYWVDAAKTKAAGASVSLDTWRQVVSTCRRR